MATQQILYYKIQGKTAIVTGFKKPDAGTLIIPESIDTIPVTAISDRAFWGHPMTGVILPPSVQSIGAFAFCSCENLAEIQIPEGVAFLRDGTFRNCRKLAQISLPDSLLRVGAFAFRGCGALTKIDYPGTETKWSRIAVAAGNEALMEAARDSNKRTSAATAAKESRQTQAEMPAKQTKPDTPPLPYGLHYKILQTQAIITDFSDRSCTHLSIPDTIEGHPVTAIGDFAFLGCSALASIRIPGSVTRIGSLAFGSCSSLQEVCYNSLPMRWHRIAVADGNEALLQAALRFPDQGDALLPTCLRYKCIGEETIILDCRPSSLRELRIPEQIGNCVVTRIADGAFLDCSSLEYIELPATLTHIGYHAFDGCTGLKEIFYAGTQKTGSALSIQPGNDCLSAAAFFFADTLPLYGQTG